MHPCLFRTGEVVEIHGSGMAESTDTAGERPFKFFPLFFSLVSASPSPGYDKLFVICVVLGGVPPLSFSFFLGVFYGHLLCTARIRTLCLPKAWLGQKV